MDPFEPERDSSAPKSEQDDVVPKATGWLINPRCKLDGATPVRRKTKHLYLKLNALAGDLKSWFAEAKKGWSPIAVAITESWLEKGLQPRAISRDLSWGVP